MDRSATQRSTSCGKHHFALAADHGVDGVEEPHGGEPHHPFAVGAAEHHRTCGARRLSRRARASDAMCCWKTLVIPTILGR